MQQMLDRINELRKEKDVAILAHYYTDAAIQELADYVGDSYYLSKLATELPQSTIMLCGVSFMGESIKLLNPEKTVIMPDYLADCPMAHMADAERIQKVRDEYEDVAVVCYINSTAAIKAHADVIVTSANALKIVKALPNRNIYFIPDENLGRYIAQFLPDKNVIFNEGFCHVHTSIKRENVLKAKELHPSALVLAHPECTPQVLELADYIGSTSGIIDFATKSPAQIFIICTEMGVLYELEQKNPGKKFYSVGHRQFCPNMKRISVEKVLRQLECMEYVVEVDKELMDKARAGLDLMLELAR